MCRFIETIKIHKSRAWNLEYHNARMQAARRAVFGISKRIDLDEHISIPAVAGQRLFRCRVVYGREILTIEYSPYRLRRIRSLKLVDGGDIDYSYKYADRTAIEDLFAMRGMCDDVLIVREGVITDTSIANIAFFDGTHWLTPDTPLLAGTKRQQLLDLGLMVPMKIRPSDLPKFQKAMVFNAMTDFNRRHAFPIKMIAGMV